MSFQKIIPYLQQEGQKEVSSTEMLGFFVLDIYHCLVIRCAVFY
jgi:hypothetical protein